MSDETVTKAIKTVSGFLRQFYYDETYLMHGSINALKVFTANQDRNYTWRIAEAFNIIFEATLPHNSYWNLVVKDMRRDVNSDEEAKELLRILYEELYLQYAIDFDEFE